MERIKQALERAKKEREANQQVRPALVNRPQVRQPSPGRGDKIVYTQTRVFEPRREVLDANRVLGGSAANAATDAYRMLRTRVLQRMRDNGWNSLMVTSAGVAEGKSLTAVNLAISLAREVTHTVMLVDLDLRRPGLHEFFGYEPEHGLADVIRGDVDLSAVLFNPSVDRLVVLPARERVENSSELLGAPEMLDVIAEIKSRYPERIVIFDMPPVLSTDDALAFSPNVDAVLLVVEEGSTSQDDLAAVYEILSDTNILGVVLNKAQEFTTAYY
jgi:exopolysaccharide/PEP-CTERM locus tyrosine autokinase